MPEAITTACRACRTPLPAGSRFCNICGAATSELPPTEFAPPPSGSPPALSAAAAPAFEEGRFVPGALVAGRYRVSGLLGKGGMGEVYRATDLKLRQPVALKFLPEAAEARPEIVDRLLSEVRIARQLSHPNICRVYDVGETDGQHYISMEYVDGEDLASLLRRIGRLPHDKALDIGRRLCAGLAAAHEKRILHRDLKPANIMLDGRGHVHIMDFGLAGLADEIEGAEVRSGTPAYMAPEQLAGKEATVKSDLYSLGLVLYELFTGKRPFEADSVGELREAQTRTPISSSTHELDPAVERAILRCLEPDPARRPPSALAVAAALPGGDPLAAALAAGETPSPEMVAAAGEFEGLRPRVAVVALLLAFAALIAGAVLAARTTLVSRIPFDNSPDALAAKAREVLENLGYSERPGDTAVGFHHDLPYIDWRLHGTAAARWPALTSGRPPAVRFWYRSSPRLLVPSSFFGPRPMPGEVTETDPPLVERGMLRLELDPQGRLALLHAIPERGDAAQPGKEPDWPALFRAAGLDIAAFSAAEPRFTPPAFADVRAAWTGAIPGGPPSGLRVEAAALRGRPVYFNIAGPWSDPDAPGRRPRPQMRVGEMLGIGLLLSGLVWGCALARWNARLGRGDRRGANRIAAFIFVVLITGWLFGASHLSGFQELGAAMMAVSRALFFAALGWMLYLALEPYARRLWPQTLISWSRLLAGDLRDPLVGKDVLFGCAAGGLAAILFHLEHITGEAAGELPLVTDLSVLVGMRHLASAMLYSTALSIAQAMIMFFLMFGLRTAFRRQWPATAAFIAVLVTMSTLETGDLGIALVLRAAQVALVAAILLRFGLLAMVVASLIGKSLAMVPITIDSSSWYFGHTVFVFIVFSGMAVWAFRVALAGQRLLRDE